MRRHWGRIYTGFVSNYGYTAQHYITHCTALMSDSWPVNVCVARPLRISQSFAVASQAPETKTFWLGPSERLERTRKHRRKGREFNRCRLPHHITSVVTKFDYSYSRLYVPKHAGHISRAGDNLSVVDESAARQISRMSAELPPAFHTLTTTTILGLEIVDRANVIQAATSNEVPRWRVSTSHDPT